MHCRNLSTYYLLHLPRPRVCTCLASPQLRDRVTAVLLLSPLSMGTNSSAHALRHRLSYSDLLSPHALSLYLRPAIFQRALTTAAYKLLGALNDPPRTRCDEAKHALRSRALGFFARADGHACATYPNAMGHLMHVR